jgi:hypothetical protein
VVSTTSVSTVGLDHIVLDSPTCSDLNVSGAMPVSTVIVASASVRPACGGQPPLLSAFEASFGLLDFCTVWKSAEAGLPASLELAPSPALVGCGPAFSDFLVTALQVQMH